MDKESVQATSPKAYDQVLEYLKTLIKNKEISYGGKIPSERELMETLGISRNSVREALRILEHTGVLESRHGKGNFLVNRMGESLSSVFSMLVLMEESNYREVNQLRSILEKQAYVQACALITAEGKEKAGEIIRRLLRTGVTRFRALFQGNRSRSEVVATFLAVLELCKNHLIRLAGSSADCTVTFEGGEAEK